MATKKTRSSLVSHNFPPFYACYLLKSIKTPRSTATYIGSTPNPPRRIRQHNGELTQGAHKTRRNRPWIMHVIVYGFPSKLSALQFEWAWQHPHVSRHLKDKQSGKPLVVRATSAKANVRTLRIMVGIRPYSKWPLHIKLFTEEAVKWWKDAIKDVDVSPLPLGLTYKVELEGVDGKSGKVGSGRVGPLDIKDEEETLSYLSKHNKLVFSNCQFKCTICKQPLPSYVSDPLTVALCPTHNCTATYHLLCLSRHFLARSLKGEDISLVPRGGVCMHCEKYVLWGDVIKGCYRRSVNGLAEAENTGDEDGNVCGFDNEGQPHESPPKRSRPRKTPGRPKQSKKGTSNFHAQSTSANVSDDPEFFDLNAISSDDEEDGVHAAPSIPRPPIRAHTTIKNHLHQPPVDAVGEFSASNDIFSDDKQDRLRSDPVVLTRAHHRPCHVLASPGQPLRTPAQRQQIFYSVDIAGDDNELPDASLRPLGKSSPLRPSKRKKGLTVRAGEVDFFSCESQVVIPNGGDDENGAEKGLIGAFSGLALSLPEKPGKFQDVIELSD